MQEGSVGLWVSGLFLGGEQEKDRTVGDKTYPGRFKVKLLVGDRVVQVEYPNEDRATAAMPDTVEVMGPLTLPIGVRSAKGYTFYYGVGGGE